MIETQSGLPSPFLSSLPLPGKLWMAISAIRWPMRISCTAFCAARCSPDRSTWLASCIPKNWRVAGQAILLLGMFVELRPAAWFSSASARVRDPMKASDAYPFLARESDRGAVVELPSKWRAVSRLHVHRSTRMQAQVTFGR